MSKSNLSILIVDDDKAFRIATMALLQDEGHYVHVAKNADEAKQRMETDVYDLILSDLVMEGMNGIELLQYIKRKTPEATVMMITGFGSVQTAVEAMRHGAYDYILKPCNNDELVIKIRRALEERLRIRELERLRSMLVSEANFSNIISRNEKMKQVFKLVKQVAETDVTVLVLGETGTGKELVAKAIHFNSQRRDLPFIPVQCSAIPETLLESELFGYEKGSFTGATRQHRGKFEEASGGTIFLDEIADIPLSVQTKLLRVLQEKQINRLGSNLSLPVDVRIIAATHRNLEDMVNKETFREDLFYRLNVFPITLPPLRERIDDIPLLAEHLLSKHQSLARTPIQGFSPAVVHDMMNYEWRGNVREMENLIKRAIIMTEGDTLSALDLPHIQGTPQHVDILDSPANTDLPYKRYIENILHDAEQKYLLRILKECKGNLNQVARIMDVDRKTIYRKVEEYRIDVSQFKD